MTLTSPSEVTAIKGRQKTNSTKKDKSYWEHVSITHRKIQKSSGSGSSFGSGSSSGSGLGSRRRVRPPRAPRGRGRGRSSRQSSLFSIIDPSPYSTFPYTDAFPCFIFELEHTRTFTFHYLDQWSGFMSLYIGSMTILPLYLYSDRTRGTRVIGHLTEQQHFIKFFNIARYK
ncbi:hypothetical protein M9H77_36136 [Catharanthus roseus]|uniref:Uncharacterized protein n=1 Tax=Catharanthus roseus TaxID=4058 RepID=A0ACB9ZS91_CATRO|nr:hypothetical protein M9H77_36136 [Catharanthus roseus]